MTAKSKEVLQRMILPDKDSFGSNLKQRDSKDLLKILESDLCRLARRMIISELKRRGVNHV